MSAKDALLKHSERAAKASDRAMKRGSKKNKKPEKEVENAVLLVAKRLGFDLHVVESKAVWSPAAGRYLRGQAQRGTSDLIGNHGGLSCWIELKAKGRRSTLKDHQHSFLSEKCRQGCFAVCVDSSDMFEFLWTSYLTTPDVDRVQFLLDALP